MQLLTLTKTQVDQLPENTTVYKIGDICSVVIDHDVIIQQPVSQALVSVLAKRAAFDMSQVPCEGYYKIYNRTSIASLLSSSDLDEMFCTAKEPVNIFVKDANEAFVIPESNKDFMQKLISKAKQGVIPSLSSYVYHKEWKKPLQKINLEEICKSHCSNEEKSVKQNHNIVAERDELEAYRATGLTPKEVETMKEKIAAIYNFAYPNNVEYNNYEDAERE